MTQQISETSEKLLLEIGRNIRRTRDLNTIWQRTVRALRPATGASRCIICPYQSKSAILPVVAECALESVSSMLGLELQLQTEPYLSQALETKEVVVAARLSYGDRFGRQSLRTVASCYQDLPNAVISLHQCDFPRRWEPVDLEFVREVADMAGSAIAHANLYQEWQSAQSQVEEALSLKSQFLLAINNQIRNPLNGIIGPLTLILDDMLDEPAEERAFLQDAYRSALHLYEMINDILNFKAKPAHMQLELLPVNFNKLLRDVQRYTLAQVLKKQLYLNIQMPAEEILVCGDYRRLLQVMLNLAGNAIEFTHFGGFSISAEVLRQRAIVHDRERPGMVEVHVSDTGIGVPVQYQRRLFEPFFRVHASTTSTYPGTGLGLAISKKLVEAMGGEIHFYSMGEGLGSTVTFTVPLY